MQKRWVDLFPNDVLFYLQFWTTSQFSSDEISKLLSNDYELILI